MMKREGKRGEVPVEDELPFNPVLRTEGGGASVQEDEDGQTTGQIKKEKRKISRF